MFLNAMKQYDKAIATLNNSIRLNPNAEDAYLKQGICY